MGSFCWRGQGRRRRSFSFAALTALIAFAANAASALQCFVAPQWRPGTFQHTAPPLRELRTVRPAAHHAARSAAQSVLQRVQFLWQAEKKQAPSVLHAIALKAKALWHATGLGSMISACWAQVAPYPPFSWIQSLTLQVWNAPKVWRYYILYTLADSVWKWLLPGLHAQVMTGLWLAFLRAFNARAYIEAVVNRVVSLLNQQAKLLSGGQPIQIPEEVLDKLCVRLRNDGELLQVLGSSPALSLWYKLERSPLDSPKLRMPEDSQQKYVLKALTDGYYRDIQAVVKEVVLVASAQEASSKMRQLHEALDAVRFAAKAKGGPLTQGTGGLMKQVDKASAEAADALITLSQAKVEAQEAAMRVGKGLGKTWQAKLDELMVAHKEVPDVVTELRRLDPSKAKGSKSSSKKN
eukprot:s349_g18.t1